MDNQLTAFETILQKPQNLLKEYLAEELIHLGLQPVAEEGFLYAAGKVPVLLVSHLDTVHQELPQIICRSKDNRYWMSPQGIGGDDRCGVFMIMQILKKANCHVLFCEDEEQGGIGADFFEASSVYPEVKYIIELDRRGCNDAVFYDCDNPEFKELVLSYGFEEAEGTFSDICVVAPHLKTAAVNISSGYYNAHRLHEYIDMQAVFCNVERVVQMVRSTDSHFAYIPKGKMQENF